MLGFSKVTVGLCFHRRHTALWESTDLNVTRGLIFMLAGVCVACVMRFECYKRTLRHAGWCVCCVCDESWR